MKNSTRAAIACSLAAAFATVSLTGCGTTAASLPVGEGGPAWIDQPNGAYDESGQKSIQAVGLAQDNPNRTVRHNQAVARARAELAKSITIQVQGLVEDYMNTNRDFYDMDGASSVEYFEEISRQVTNQTLVGSKQVDAWRDPVTNEEYILMRVDFDDVIHSYKERMAASFEREMQRKRIKAQKDQFENKLDEQIEKLNQAEIDQIRAMAGDGA